MTVTKDLCGLWLWTQKW